MARQMERLTALAVSRAKTPGYFADGGGLYLQVTVSGAKSWCYRFMLHGRAREMGLGPLSDTSLSEARGKALEARRLRREGVDPIEHRKASRAAARLDAANSITFDECAKAYMQAHRPSWRSAKHAAEWGNTLATYASPVFGDQPVQSIDTELVVRALGAIWTTKFESAVRLRGRIESILDWATVRGYRKGENPARWRGHLETQLPKRSKLALKEHHSALEFGEIGAFMEQLRAWEGVAARALEFAILTAARSGEVRGARWSEIDMASASWAMPAERMKGGRPHRVPLADRALTIVEAMRAARTGDFLFPGQRPSIPLGNLAMVRVLQRMNRSDLTVHGFRSSFRDWAAEQTAYPNEVVEMALAHAVGNKVEAAYRRGDLFDKRRRLMDDWAAYCEAPVTAGTVVPIRSAKREA